MVILMPGVHDLKALGEVDLRAHPDSIEELKASETLTVGDLHGNAIKLIWILINRGILSLKKLDDGELNSPQACYKKLLDIYQKNVDDLSREDLDLFSNILAAADFRAPELLRLIGDELGDRGSNDYFMIVLLKLLKQREVPFEILLSNHGVGFLECFQSENRKDYAPIDERYAEQDDPFAPLGTKQSHSLKQLEKLMNRGLVSKAELMRFRDDVYQPALRAISYSVDRTQASPLLTLSAHAPVGLETVSALAALFKVPYDESSLEAMCHTIDRVNEQFQLSLQDKSFYRHWFQQDQYAMYAKDLILGQIVVPIDYPLARVTWNRRTGDDALDLPKQRNGFQLKVIHGHDGPEPCDIEGFINTDNDCGKRTQYGVLLTLLVSSDKPAMVLEHGSLENYRHPRIDSIIPAVHEALVAIAKEYAEAITGYLNQHDYANKDICTHVLEACVIAKLDKLKEGDLNKLYKNKGFREALKEKQVSMLKNELVNDETFTVSAMELSYDMENHDGFQISTQRHGGAPVLMSALDKVKAHLRSYHGGKSFVQQALRDIDSNIKQPFSKQLAFGLQQAVNALDELIQKLAREEKQHYAHMFFFRHRRQANSHFRKILPKLEEVCDKLKADLKINLLLPTSQQVTDQQPQPEGRQALGNQ